MPETSSEAVAPVATMSSTSLTKGQKRVVILLALLFALFPLVFIGDVNLRGVHLSDLDAAGFFFSLGVLPGAIAAALFPIAKPATASTTALQT